MILSIIIIIFILMGVIIGAKRGFIYQLIKMLSTILVVLLALLFKNFVANIFINHFNFIDMNPSISIIFYRGISFIILCFIFKLVFRLLLKFSKRLENILDKTIILGIPSKILGGILGFIEYYIYTVIILSILSIPVFNINVLSSGVARGILKGTPKIYKIDTSLFTELQDISNRCNDLCEDEYMEVLRRHGIIKESK